MFRGAESGVRGGKRKVYYYKKGKFVKLNDAGSEKVSIIVSLMMLAGIIS